MGENVSQTAERIKYMEAVFDSLRTAVDGKQKPQDALLQELMDYYENGRWLHDYQLDEQGLLPAGLKRGVLSEDGVYNLLSDIKALNEESMRANIRPAAVQDAGRLAEIEIFNYRLYFYPIFHCDDFYFQELTVENKRSEYAQAAERTWVYDDGAVKGFIRMKGTEIEKLFVEPVLHSQGIGAVLLQYAVENCGAQTLWALEKNTRAVAFYKRHGFCETGEKKMEEDTDEYLIQMTKKQEG